MKSIITGSTGMIGTEVLLQCLQHPSITSIIALSRRQLAPTIAKSPRLKVIILEDFMIYPQDVLQEMADATACIWCLGGLVRKFPTLEIARKVNVDYTIAAANAWVDSFIPLPRPTPWRRKEIPIRVCEWNHRGERPTSEDIIHGQHAKDEGAHPPLGEVINTLAEIGERHSDIFEALFARPGGAVPDGLNPASVFMAVTKMLRMDKVFESLKSLQVDELAAAMIEIALKGYQTQDISHDTLEFRGKELLKRIDEVNGGK